MKRATKRIILKCSVCDQAMLSDGNRAWHAVLETGSGHWDVFYGQLDTRTMTATCSICVSRKSIAEWFSGRTAAS